MKAERPYPQIAITPKGEAALTGGHPWVYEGEVTSVSGAPADGDLVDVVSRRGSWLGAGFYNSRSLIRVRLLSRNPNDRFDPDFWARRVKYAWDYRKTVMAPEELTCCRVIFGEADHFPGLTVDRFGPVLVAQVLCLGLDRVKDTIFSQLVRVLRADGQDIAGVYERNDVALRDKEGMAQGKGWYPLAGEPLPDFTCADITENGIRYTVDFENGQKTGFFLDQKYNRQAVARLARGKTVLDCFTHTGSFALNAAFLPSIMLSGFIFQIDSMPAVIRAVTYIIPARYFVSTLQSLFLAGNIPVVLVVNVLFLIASAVMFIGLTWLKTKRRLD